MKDLNFFSIYQGNIKARKDEKIYIYIAVVVLATIIVLTSGVYVVKLFSIDNSIKNYTNKLNSDIIQTKFKEATIVNDKLSILNEYEGSLSSVIKSMKDTNLVDDKLLIGISGAVPSDISISEWKMEGYDLTMKGITKSRSAVAELEHNLRILPEFKLVHVDEIKVGNTAGDDFTFKITSIVKEVE